MHSKVNGSNLYTLVALVAIAQDTLEMHLNSFNLPSIHLFTTLPFFHSFNYHT